MKMTMSMRVNAYLARRRALGYKLTKEGLLLLNFARYADRVGHRGPLTRELALRWATLPRNAHQSYRARRLQTLGVFARFQIALEPATELLPRHVLGPVHSRRPPHIFSAHQLRHLLKRADFLRGRLQPLTYRTLIGLLACSGLRISEALALTTKDVDFHQAVLHVGQSKYQHSRLVPLHRAVLPHLCRYQRRRNKICPEAKHFFVSETGDAVGYFNACRTFRGLARQVRPSNGRRNVRLHDLRHTFACRVLLTWQRSHRGAIGRMLTLSRVMGHTHVRDTYWYLSAFPDLLQQVAGAFAPFDPSVV